VAAVAESVILPCQAVCQVSLAVCPVASPASLVVSQVSLAVCQEVSQVNLVVSQACLVILD
jgi:hypothetical protein